MIRFFLSIETIYASIHLLSLIASKFRLVMGFY